MGEGKGLNPVRFFSGISFAIFLNASTPNRITRSGVLQEKDTDCKKKATDYLTYAIACVYYVISCKFNEMTTTNLSPEEYFEKIRPLRNPDEIKALCQQLKQQWRNKAPKTIVNNLTPYNKLMRKLPVEELEIGKNAYSYSTKDGKSIIKHLHFHPDYAGFSYEEHEQMKKNPALKTERIENKVPINPIGYLEKASELLLSEAPHELAAGLIAVSGRRPIEINARGSFRLIEPGECPQPFNAEYAVWFKGQAKKRDYELPEEEKPEFPISTLVPAKAFIKAFNRFRAMPETKEIVAFMKSEDKAGKPQEQTNKAIADRRNRSIDRAVKNEFPDVLPPRYNEESDNSKVLRSAYTCLAVKRDCPPQLDELLFASRLLGHYIIKEKASDQQLKSLEISIGYKAYYVEGEMFFAPAPQKRKKEESKNIRAWDSDIKRIKELQEDWNLPNHQSVITKLIQSVEELKELRNEVMKLTEQLHSKEKEVEQSREESVDLKTMVKQLVSEALREELSKLQLPSLPQQQASEQPTQPRTESKPQEVKPEKDWESVADEELRDSKERGVAEEKVSRSFLAIVNHNDYKATETDNKWVIGVRSLQELAGVNHAVASRWVDAHKPLIDDHNAKHNLSQYHNQRHGKAGIKIWSVIDCPWNSKGATNDESATANE